MYLRLLPVLLVAFLCTSLSTQAQSLKVPAKKWDKGYFPKDMPKVHFGMSLALFALEHKNISDLSSETYTFRKVFLEEVEGAPFDQVIYYFDAEGDKPLYEVILIYPEGVNVEKVARGLYGPPNNGEEWSWTHKKGHPVNIWVYKQKIVIAAVMPGTEWVE